MFHYLGYHFLVFVFLVSYGAGIAALQKKFLPLVSQEDYHVAPLAPIALQHLEIRSGNPRLTSSRLRHPPLSSVGI